MKSDHDEAHPAIPRDLYDLLRRISKAHQRFGLTLRTDGCEDSCQRGLSLRVPFALDARQVQSCGERAADWLDDVGHDERNAQRFRDHARDLHVV